MCPDRKAYSLPDLGLDDAYKVLILIWFLLGQNKMRRRHLGSVSAAPYGRCLGIVRIQPQLKR